MKDKTGVDLEVGRYDFDLDVNVERLIVGTRRLHPDPDTLDGALAEIFFVKEGTGDDEDRDMLDATIRVYEDRLEFWDGNRATLLRKVWLTSRVGL